MEKWDKGIQMFDEAAPVDPEVMEKLRLIQDYENHRAGVHLIHDAPYVTDAQSRRSSWCRTR